VTRSATASLRIGLVGFGRLARSCYVPAVGRLRGASVVAVADPLEASRVAAATALPGAAICRGMEELLAHRPDALLVATPPSTHLALWNVAQESGLPVFMEKPFVLAGQLADAADDAGARGRLMVNFNRHFWPPYRRLRALVADDRIGRIVSAEFVLHVDLLPWCSVTRHRLSPDDGGVVHDLASQALAFVPWLLGAEPVSVEATLASHRWPDDHLTLRLGFADGARATCDLAYEARTFERVAITGTTGRVRLEDPNMALHLEPASHRRGRGRLRDLAVFGYRGLRRSHSMARYSIHAALAAFVEATRHQRPPVPGWDAAVQNVRALEAAMLAARRGRVVPLEMAS
jgi:predicted dehydrogenase